jgi:hypothetical protein
VSGVGACAHGRERAHVHVCDPGWQITQYRGAAPIHHALLNGEETTGISVIQIRADVTEFDAGAVLARKIVPIQPDDTFATCVVLLASSARRTVVIQCRCCCRRLAPRLAREGAEAILDVLAAGDACPRMQQIGDVTLAPKLHHDVRVRHVAVIGTIVGLTYSMCACARTHAHSLGASTPLRCGPVRVSTTGGQQLTRMGFTALSLQLALPPNRSPVLPKSVKK